MHKFQSLSHLSVVPRSKPFFVGKETSAEISSSISIVPAEIGPQDGGFEATSI